MQLQHRRFVAAAPTAAVDGRERSLHEARRRPAMDGARLRRIGENAGDPLVVTPFASAA
jgi:hypothetical protein